VPLHINGRLAVSSVSTIPVFAFVLSISDGAHNIVILHCKSQHASVNFGEHNVMRRFMYPQTHFSFNKFTFHPM
jgi:Flp pilus assembly protein protease CpaA